MVNKLFITHMAFHRPVIVPWALWENNALLLANQSMRFIDYKRKLYNNTDLNSNFIHLRH